MTTFALQRDRRQPSPDDFPTALAELLGYLEDALPEGHPFANLAHSLPGLPHTPDVWLLGSSLQSAVWAAELGLPYAFADFIAPRNAPVANRYREEFTRATRTPAPHVAVAVSVVCAPTAEEAEYLVSSQRMAAIERRQGVITAIPHPDRAVAFLAARPHQPPPPGQERRLVVDDPVGVRATLEEIARDYGADELVVVTITHDHAARRRSYELVAEAFGLRRGGLPSDGR